MTAQEQQEIASCDLNKLSSLFQKKWLLPLLLFLFPLILHLLYKNAGVYHFDTAFDLWAIEETVKTNTIVYSYGWGAPGNIVLMALLFKIDSLIRGATSAEFVYFLVNFIAASLSSVVLYALVHQLTKQRFVSIAAALLLAVHPIWLSVTTYPKTLAITVLAGLAGMYYVAKAIQEPKYRYLIGAGALFGFAMSIRPFAGFFVIAAFILFTGSTIRITNGKLAISKQHWNIPKLAAAVAVLILVPTLLMLPRIIHVGGVQEWRAQLAGEQRGGWQGLFSDQLKISAGYVTTSIGILGWIIAALGAVWLALRKRFILLATLLIWFGCYLFYLGNLLPTEARFVMEGIPALLTIIAFGCDAVYQKKKWAGIVLLLILMITMFSVIHPIIKARHEYSGSRGFAEFVRDNTESNAWIIIGDQHVFMTRYANRSVFGAPDNVRGKARVDLIEEKIKNGTPMYLAETGIMFLTPEEQQIIQDRFVLGVIGSARNEVYQFSELEQKPYEERLIKLIIKEQALLATENMENATQN